MTSSDDVDLAAEARATAEVLLNRDWSSVTGVEAARMLAALRFLRGEPESRAGRGYHFTIECRQVLAGARTVALESGHGYVGTEQMLLALVRHEGGTVLRRLGIDPDVVQGHLAPYMKAAPSSYHRSGGEIVYTSRAKRALELTMAESARLGHRHVRADHIVLGLIREDTSPGALALADAGVTCDSVRAAVVEYVRRVGDTP